jgi:hypothetical protein
VLGSLDRMNLRRSDRPSRALSPQTAGVTSESGRHQNSTSEKLLRGNLWACIACGIIGIVAAVFFFVTGDALLGWIFVVLTALLIPAYFGLRWALHRRSF